jgi:hypothetical protein
MADSATLLTRLFGNNGRCHMFNSSCQNTSGVVSAPDALTSMIEKAPNIICCSTHDMDNFGL